MTDPNFKPLYHTVLSLTHLQQNMEPLLEGTGIRLVQGRQVEGGPKPTIASTRLEVHLYDDVSLEELRSLVKALDLIVLNEETRLVDQGIRTWRNENNSATRQP